MAAFVVDRARVEIAHLADRLRQSAERRHLRPGGMLLRPHSLEFGIALDVRARRPLPAAAEAGEPGLEIKKKRIALLLAVVADVDARFALLCHDRSHRLTAGALDLGHVDRVATSTQRIEPRQLARPRQAAGMGRQIFSSCCAAWRCLAQFDIRAGSHSASSGQKMTRPSTMNMIRWNGIVPITTSLSLPSQMLWMTNRLMPIGGEIWPSSIKMTRTTPNRIGSMP